jgi:hypothetical protein
VEIAPRVPFLSFNEYREHRNRTCLRPS